MSSKSGAEESLRRRHRAALVIFELRRADYLILGELPRGIGDATILDLIRMGLIEMGISERFIGKAGWRITDAGAALCELAGNFGD